MRDSERALGDSTETSGEFTDLLMPQNRDIEKLQEEIVSKSTSIRRRDPRRVRRERLGFVVLMVIGWLLVGAVGYSLYHDLSTSWVTVPGVVKSTEEREYDSYPVSGQAHRRDKPSVELRVNYEYAFGEVTYRGSDVVSAQKGSNLVLELQGKYYSGRMVDVEVNPSQPSNSRLQLDRTVGRGVAIFMLVLSSLLVVVSAQLLRRTSRPESRGSRDLGNPPGTR